MSYYEKFNIIIGDEELEILTELYEIDRISWHQSDFRHTLLSAAPLEIFKSIILNAKKYCANIIEIENWSHDSLNASLSILPTPASSVLDSTLSYKDNTEETSNNQVVTLYNEDFHNNDGFEQDYDVELPDYESNATIFDMTERLTNNPLKAIEATVNQAQTESIVNTLNVSLIVDTGVKDIFNEPIHFNQLRLLKIIRVEMIPGWKEKIELDRLKSLEAPDGELRVKQETIS
ncbi:hypothetical protein ACJJTC_008353 [Scirpophaga incertulas]